MSEWAYAADFRCGCGGETQVVNTRGRKERDVVYRQRRCRQCQTVFPTFETTINPAVALRGIDAARLQLLEAVDVARKALAELRPAEIKT